MKILINSLLILCLPFFNASAQTKEQARVKAKAEAAKMGKALVAKDYAIFVKSTYPKAVNKADGGLEKLATDLKKQVEGMEAEGTTILAAWPGEPSAIIDTAGEWQCTIPQKITMQLPEGKLTTQTTLIAMSPDKGGIWYFVDMAERNLEDMRTIFPNMSSKLKIPVNPGPKFEAAK